MRKRKVRYDRFVTANLFTNYNRLNYASRMTCNCHILELLTSLMFCRHINAPKHGMLKNIITENQIIEPFESQSVILSHAM